jgi:ABC-type multidrug transport system fused ATPase/permease subunit
MENKFGDEHTRFWGGSINRAIRYYFYIQRGLALLNEFRYLIIAIMAMYALLKMDNPWMMLVMFIVAVPVLIILGWMFTHKMAAVMDYLNIKYSTHYGKLNMEYQERQTKALEDIQSKVSRNDFGREQVEISGRVTEIKATEICRRIPKRKA